jgi:hypothetical protein
VVGTPGETVSFLPYNGPAAGTIDLMLQISNGGMTGWRSYTQEYELPD